MIITNIVSMSHMYAGPHITRLDLEWWCRAVQGKLDTDVFPAVVSKMHEMRMTFTWFATLNVVCPGARTREDACASHNIAAYTAFKLMRSHRHPINIHVTNIVTSASLGCTLRMNDIDAMFNHRGQTWRPTVFSGMTVPHHITTLDGEYKVAFIVFANGNINVTGVRHENHLPALEYQMKQLFLPFAEATIAPDHASLSASWTEEAENGEGTLEVYGQDQ